MSSFFTYMDAYISRFSQHCFMMLKKLIQNKDTGERKKEREKERKKENEYHSRERNR